MGWRDFLLLSLVCLVFGLNFTVTKFALSGGGEFDGLPPFFFVGVRMLAIAVLLAPLLAKPPPNPGLVAAYAMIHGAVHFSLLFIGIHLSTPSAAAVVFPIYVPMATVLSVVFLGDHVGLVRSAGIAASVLGVMIIGFDPGSTAFSLGVLAVAGAGLAAAVSTILNRRIAGALGPMQSQAWVGAVSFAPLLIISFLFESDQVSALAQGGAPLYAAIAYSVLPVSIFGHAAYFFIIGRNSPTIVTPLSLMATVWGVLFGVWLMNDPVTWRLIAGGALTLAGVLVVMMRGSRAQAEAAAPEVSAR